MRRPHIPGVAHKPPSMGHSLLSYSSAPHSIVLPGVKHPHFIGGSPPPGDAAPDTSRAKPSSSEVCSWDRWLNDLLVRIDELSLCESVEQSMQKFFKAEKVIYWENVPSLKQLYSATFGLTTAQSSGLVGFCYFSRAPVRLAAPSSHPSFHSLFDGHIVPQGAAAFLFPLTDAAGEIVAIVEVVRATDVAQFELRFADWFARKFRAMHRWLDVPADVQAIVAAIQACETEDAFRKSVFPRQAFRGVAVPRAEARRHQVRLRCEERSRSRPGGSRHGRHLEIRHLQLVDFAVDRTLQPGRRWRHRRCSPVRPSKDRRRRLVRRRQARKCEGLGT
jgi:hypothetical protein